LEVRAFLDAKVTQKPRTRKHTQLRASRFRDLIPRSQTEAATRLQEIAALDRRQLRASEKRVFLRGWFALFYLFPGLHPDNALDHGDPTSLWSLKQLALPGLEDFATHRFARSGWPVALELLGREAWRRYELAELSGREFYCSVAQCAGMHHRGECASNATTPADAGVRRSENSHTNNKR
jgi:DNA (cytosine-5)-methyltransferase 1